MANFDELSTDVRGGLDPSGEITMNLVTGTETTNVEFLLPSDSDDAATGYSNAACKVTAAPPPHRHGGLIAQTHMTS